jgi:hypothetical protein
LGRHFTLDGSWVGQAERAHTVLTAALGAITQRQLPPSQLIYYLNTVVIPKLTFPLSAPTLFRKKTSNIASEMDRRIAEFVREHLQLDGNAINYDYFYTSAKHWGLNLNSVRDICEANIITETLIGLNDTRTHSLDRYRPQPCPTLQERSEPV